MAIQVITNFKFIHEKFKLNGVYYSNEALLHVASNFIKEGEPYEKEVGKFLQHWLDENEFVVVKTSGSTGTPKSIKIKKQAMVNSALATGEFFDLKPSDKALHCLPTRFIAGKMMLVRAMVLGLEIDLEAPTAHPDFNIYRAYNFCAMVPLQLDNILQDFNLIKTIIVGGAPVSTALIEKLQGIDSHVYESYGMTETVTHIALKKLNNLPPSLRGKAKRSAESFKTLPNIRISKDERDCLVIDAPKLSEEKIITNDLVEIYSETEFKWLGRIDNVINSGGLKFFPEQIEAKLQDKIQARFFIASKPHETLGEQLILLVEGGIESIDPSAFSSLKRNERPKNIFTLKQFVETASGKVQRKKTVELISHNWS
ncbi:2-succinylbenzoate--CoA ligase [Mariniflexile rhizosphaerae]|uniref:AMP-binding protein n=1 Tax=unclassified Mariniflexile TaxID=2643887 RepID=UPI000CB0B866|nr:AMP-binding protein [Mariniflexile sp. TRM1-10]AXP82373.1 2-succinylbenzoate--CoA ligase [Mariniflexile sp. TRM1-10]PLB20474.1 MAG: O-succinylbenzoic acid-CoA ligase [Flavobacteriaceae bacterium FS1-H7996/R]